MQSRRQGLYVCLSMANMREAPSKAAGWAGNQRWDYRSTCRPFHKYTESVQQGAHANDAARGLPLARFLNKVLRLVHLQMQRGSLRKARGLQAIFRPTKF